MWETEIVRKCLIRQILIFLSSHLLYSMGFQL